MKTAAVLGAGSMLGTELVRKLRLASVEVITIGRSADADIHYDLNGPEFDVGSLKADVVFHCAASFGGDSREGVRQNMSANAASAVAVGDLVAELGASALIYAGSIFSDPSAEATGLNSYGLSKGMAEHYFAWAMSKRHFRFCSVRFSQLFDTEGRSCAHQPWFGRIIAYASRGLDIRMPGSDGVRNFIHINDAATAMMQASNEDFSGVLNYVSPVSMTTDQIAEVAFEGFSKGGNVVIVPEKLKFRPMYFPKTSDFLAPPKISMKKGIELIKAADTAGRFGPMDLD